jgi:hypothetical protein
MKRLAGVVVWAVALSAQADPLPEGWFGYPHGSATRELNGWGGKPVLVLHTTAPGPNVNEGFANVGSSFSARKYAGRRLRFSAWLRSESIADWGGLWMRIDGKRADGPKGATLAFDNMQDRAIRGTTPWTRYEIVLDVPAEAQTVLFGMLKRSEGTLFMADPQIEPVGTTVPVTGGPPAEPQLNLGADANPLAGPIESGSYKLSLGEEPSLPLSQASMPGQRRRRRWRGTS